MNTTFRFPALLIVLASLGCDSGNSEQVQPADAAADGQDAAAEHLSDAGTEVGQDDANDVPDVEPLFPTEREVIIPLDGQVLFPVRLDGNHAHLVVDTGAVRSAFSEQLLRDVANGVGVTTVDFGDGIVFEDYEVLAADLSEAEKYIGVPIHGLIGQDLFEYLYFGLDYRRSKAIVAKQSPSTPPSGWQENDRIVLPYELVQGLPILTVEVEGKPLRLIADTGSGVTLITKSSVPPSWLSNEIQGYAWHTSYGSDEATIIRIPSLGLGSAHVEGSWGVVIPDEHHLAAVFSAIGLDVDGFLGYPVYRMFYWGIRGADSIYEAFLQQGPDPFAENEWNRVGIEVVGADDGILIDMLFSPSSAFDEGVRVGDALRKIDEVPVDDWALDDVRRLLRGSVGEVRKLGLLRDGVDVNASVRVDALVP